MNKQKLLDQIKFYQDEYLKASRRVDALSGAIEDCQFWLSELEKEEEAAKAPPGPILVPDAPPQEPDK